MMPHVSDARLASVMQRLLSLLFSSIDDQWVETRIYSLHVLTHIIRTHGSRFNGETWCFSVFYGLIHMFQSHSATADEQVTNTYQELMNRLNDSNDSVLMLTVRVFGEFFTACGSLLSSGQAKIIYEPMFTHLDDSNEAVQNVVCDFLCTYGPRVHPESLVDVIDANKQYHRYTHLWTAVLRACGREPSERPDGPVSA